MDSADLSSLLNDLCSLPRETEWVEFKHNRAEPEEIGEYLSTLANSATLHRKDTAYMVWGVEDSTHNVVGTTFRPHEAKIGNVSRIIRDAVDAGLVKPVDPETSK